MQVENPTDPSSSKARREKKEPFKIDFTSPSEKSLKEITKDLLAPTTRGATLTLPHYSAKSSSKKTKRRKGKNSEKKVEQTHPDDMHFSSRQLITLFLKPDFAVSMYISSQVIAT
jgi:condensin complex subunit 2